MQSVLIVEDEFLIALDLEAIVADAGFGVVGIAADLPAATVYAARPRIALVDLNLRDGPTGTRIAGALSRQGTTIIYLTANPDQIGEPAPTALGFVRKPYSSNTIRWALNAAAAGSIADAPADFVAFEGRKAA